MPATKIAVEDLRGLIGRRVQFRDATYTVIEILEAEPAIVLEPDRHTPDIQPDAYGNARRQGRALLTIPVFDTDRKRLHADFRALNVLPGSATDGPDAGQI